MLVLTGVVAAAGLTLYPPPLLIVVGGSIGLAAITSIAVARLDVAVAIGMLLLGVVVIEPAPPDAVFAVVIAVAAVTGRFSFRGTPLSVFAFLTLFFSLSIFSVIEAIDASRAVLYLGITVYLIVFSVWLAGYVDSVARAGLVVKSYVIGAAVIGAASTLALFVPIPGGDLLLTSDQLRAQGLFQDPNVYGPFLVPAALIVLEELINPRLLLWRPSVKTVTFAVLVVGATFSYSRATWINTVLGALVLLAVLALRRGGSRRAVTVLVVLAAGVALTASILSATGSLAFLEERATLQSYDNDRFAAQRLGLELAFQKPLGIGPGQFEVISPVATHSTYVRALAEQGVLGLVAMLGILFGTLVLATRNAVMGRDSYGVGSAALLGSWVGLLVNSAVVDTAHWRGLWFVAALIWIGATRSFYRPPLR